MNPSIRQLIVFHLKQALYKNFKFFFKESPDYQQWRLNRGKKILDQVSIHQEWQRRQHMEVIEKLTKGSMDPRKSDLDSLRLRAFLYRHLKTLFKRSRAYQRWHASRNESPSTQIVSHLRWKIIDSALTASAILKGTIKEARRIKFPVYEKPAVSILIPVYNKIEYTLTCLFSIQLHLPSAPFEIIVIDDCSADHTPQLLSEVTGIRTLRNKSNLGFLRNCNKAAKEALGEYLLFLNNDTEVQQGWMDEMLWTFRAYPDAGLVGSKLLFPYGRLQEAGGIIWEDATGCNYGREADPERPEFCYLREPDYCSGASIMIPAELFSVFGGFDERFSPAYYEDTDLAFTVREHGRRVIFQPFSRVIHHEGITSGTDVTKGVKSYQLLNQAKFLDKWRESLAKHGRSNQTMTYAKERLVTKRALIVDATFPKPDQDSGSVDAIYEIKVLQALGYKVTCIPDDVYYITPYTETLQRMGVECLYQPYTSSVKEHLESSGEVYDIAIVKRVPVASRYIQDVRRYCSNAKIIFNTVDLHFLREERQAIIENSDAVREQAKKTKELEYWVMKQSDATIVISDAERNLISNEYPDIMVSAIPYIRSVTENRPPFSSRHGIVFIGGFQHLPNVDALLYFVQKIWPLVRDFLPGVTLHIVGSNAPPQIRELGKVPGIVFDGYVPDLDTVFHSCRLSVAPLRFGAGIKGKIGTSLGYGVPCIATTLAAEGMKLTDQQDILLASDPPDFADSIVKVYSDEVLWQRLSANGIAYMREHYSFEQGVERFRTLINSIH